MRPGPIRCPALDPNLRPLPTPSRRFPRRLCRWRPRAASTLTATVLALPLAAAAPEAPRPTLAAGVATQELRIDGRLDEPAWDAAPAIERLVMVEPHPGATATLHTRVRVLAGPRAIVVGVRCQDDNPRGIVSFTKERDGNLDAEDHVRLVFDTFLDGHSGFVFAANPGGARYDALVSSGGASENANWDGVWEAATQRDATGWTLELRVPIETLAFKPGLTTWGFNIQRRIQRLQETNRWASPQLDFALTQMARAGRLEGLPAFDDGLGLSVRPSLVGGFEDAAGRALTGRRDASLDAVQRLGPARARLSINTDFAETEVDTRQTNLTRFPLFFPEKRAFFLEGADVFEFGAGLRGAIAPFFTRRIGLVGGRPVPLLAGLKLNGRFGGTSIASLAVRTRRAPGQPPAVTLGALRIKQNVFAESEVGILATLGDPVGRADAAMFGADIYLQSSRFRGRHNVVAGLWWLTARRADLVGTRSAWGAKLAYPNDLVDASLVYRRIGSAFDPSLGFVPRRSVKSYVLTASWNPRPERSFVRQRFHQLEATLDTDLQDRWESYRALVTPFNWQLESGERFEASVAVVGERLRQPFEVARDVRITPDAYDWRRYGLVAQSAAKRRLAGQASWTTGGFYSGRLDELNVEATWTPSPLLTLQLSAEHNTGRVVGQRLRQTLVGTRVRLNLSPDVQLNSFIQYDTDSRVLGANTRLRWTFNPRGEAFVVYNHDLRRVTERLRFDANALLVKVQYTLQR